MDKFEEQNKRRLDRTLTIAEATDALRIFPRLMVALYAWACGWVINWYFTFEPIRVVKCDAASLNVLLTNKVPLEQAQAIACGVTDVLGHPASYTTLVATMIGAAAVVFGFYTNTGRKWGN